MVSEYNKINIFDKILPLPSWVPFTVSQFTKYLCGIYISMWSIDSQFSRFTFFGLRKISYPQVNSDEWIVINQIYYEFTFLSFDRNFWRISVPARFFSGSQVSSFEVYPAHLIKNSLFPDLRVCISMIRST